jgi:hypothetical protein
MMKLGDSLPWCQAERDYWKQFIKIDWGLVNTSPYDNTTYSYYGYQATNWNEKPIADRIRILVDLRKGQSMMGRYQNPPFAPYPTIYNYRDRVFKRVMDNIQGAGQYLDIPWKDYVGVTHTIKLKEK